MSRRPIATVRVLRLPHLAEGAVRVEIDCRYSTTGYTQIPPENGLELDVPALVTIAIYTHQERCGDCDTSEANKQGDQRVRDHVEWLSASLQAIRDRRYFQEVRK